MGFTFIMFENSSFTCGIVFVSSCVSSHVCSSVSSHVFSSVSHVSSLLESWNGMDILCSSYLGSSV